MRVDFAAEKLTKWYVIQVRTTMEDSMCRQIERACQEHDKAAKRKADRVGLKECFNPRFRTQRKWKGEWQNVEHSLLPGCVLADVKNPEQLAVAIRPIRDLCHLLSDGETYLPLDDNERMWMNRKTERGNRIIPMSFARKVGDRIEITDDSALYGYEGIIKKVDRKNSLAHIEIHVGPITIKTKVGLGIIPD